MNQLQVDMALGGYRIHPELLERRVDEGMYKIADLLNNLLILIFNVT